MSVLMQERRRVLIERATLAAGGLFLQRPTVQAGARLGRALATAHGAKKRESVDCLVTAAMLRLPA